MYINKHKYLDQDRESSDFGDDEFSTTEPSATPVNSRKRKRRNYENDASEKSATPSSSKKRKRQSGDNVCLYLIYEYFISFYYILIYFKTFQYILKCFKTF